MLKLSNLFHCLAYLALKIAALFDVHFFSSDELSCCYSVRLCGETAVITPTPLRYQKKHEYLHLSRNVLYYRFSPLKASV